MKQAVMFLVVGVVLIALCAVVLLLLYESADDRRAVTLAALIAVITQGVAYAIVRGMAARNVIACSCA